MNGPAIMKSQVLAALLLVAAPFLHGVAWGLSWPISIKPSGGGTVEWMTSSPPANGVLEKSGKVTFDEGAFVDLTFRANDGLALFSVFRDKTNFTFFLDGNDHFQFGPVGNSHKIVATFVVLTPTGSFDFPFPTDNPLLTAIAFLTGNYTGVMPGPFMERSYDIDVSMDEAGKLVGMATIDGVEPEPGGDPFGGTGKVKTVDGAPMMQLKVKFEGTLDGMPAKLKAGGTGPVEVADLGGGTLGFEGSTSYNAKLGGVPFKEKNLPVQTSIDMASADNVAKDWSLHLDLSEKVNARGKPFIASNAELVLPGGDRIVFDERKAKFSLKKGYSLKFTKGTNVTMMPPAVAKKPKIQIKQMRLTQNGPDWEPVAGTIKYQFLGQKGEAELVDFLVP